MIFRYNFTLRLFIALLLLSTLFLGCKERGVARLDNLSSEVTADNFISSNSVDNLPVTTILTSSKQIDSLPQYGDALSISVSSEPLNLIPAISSDSASHDITGYIYSGLVRYDKDIKLEGDLAKSWKISADNKEITFFLRDNVTWHDGVAFTAEDVIFTYKFMIDNNTPTSYDGDFQRVESIKAIDNYTVVVKYAEPYAPALNSWGIWIMPKHLLEGVNPLKSNLQKKPIGTGAFILEEWITGRSIRLKAFDRYYEGRPKLDKVLVRLIPDFATQYLELLNGGIDTMGLSAMQATKQTDNPRYKSQYNTYSYLDNSYVYVGYNIKRSPFNNVLVRQALSYATPKDDIIQGLLFGKGVKGKGPYKPGTIWYNDNVTEYNYSLEKASLLLKEAGYELNKSDGFLYKDGKRFKIDIATNQGNVIRSQIAEVLQRSYKLIGIDAEVRIIEWATFITEYINKGNFSVIVMGWNIVPDPDLYDVWHSSRCGGNGLNFICYKNDQLDRLIVDATKTYDINKRKYYYDKVQEILAKESPYTFLYVPYANVAMSKRFKNIITAPAGLKHNIIDWYVNKDEQRYSFKP